MNAVADLYEVVGEPGARTLLFMPLAHVFARFIEVLCIPAGAVLGHTPDTLTLIEDLASFQPSFILAVPRVFEKVYNSAEQKAAAGGKSAIFQRAAKTSIVYSRALDTPRGPSPWLRLQHKVADVLVLKRLRAALGGNAKWAISGGAPLGERLGHFYRGLGLNVLEGYGLTETTAPATVNRPGKGTKIGTVGSPCRVRRSGSPRTARSRSRASRCSAATTPTTPRPRSRSPTDGSAPVTWVRSTTRATCGSRAARRRSSSRRAARTSRPRCSRTASGRTRSSAR